MRKIVHREFVGGYRLRLCFDDGIRKVIDFSRLLKWPAFSTLQDIRRFRKAKVNGRWGCLEWPNGIDMHPDDLYDENGIVEKGEPMAKKKCRVVYRVKARSKRSRTWRWAFYGCSKRRMEEAARMLKEQFGGDAKVVAKRS